MENSQGGWRDGELSTTPATANLQEIRNQKMDSPFNWSMIAAAGMLVAIALGIWAGVHFGWFSF